MNDDRHDENISYDKPNKRLQIFDHSHALLGNQNIPARFDQAKDSPYLGGHCLLRHITSLNGLKSWYNKINSIPEFYIREVITSTVPLGLQGDLVEICIAFFLDRRKRLIEILKSNKNIFPQVASTEWDAY